MQTTILKKYKKYIEQLIIPKLLIVAKPLFFNSLYQSIPGR